MKRSMRLASLLSGGKDSVYAIDLSLRAGHEVPYAVTVFPERDDSYMFHVPNLWVTSLQTESMGITHITRESSGVKEQEVKDLSEALSGLQVDGVVAGAIASNYQYSRISRVCEALGLEVVAPLWGADPHGLLDDMLASGYKIMVVGVYADGMGPEWLGRILDERAIVELTDLESRRGVAASFEGGEAETLVLDCPIFASEVVVKSTEIRWATCRGEYLVREAFLRKKRQLNGRAAPA